MHNGRSVLCGHCLDKRDNRALTIKTFFIRAVPLSFRSGHSRRFCHISAICPLSGYLCQAAGGGEARLMGQSRGGVIVGNSIRLASRAELGDALGR
jgi:hypothetical protein